jgi:hypothetical protein
VQYLVKAVFGTTHLAVLTNQLTPWRQNPKVHHPINNSPPPVPILSQVNPLHTPPTNLPKVHSDPILPSMPWSSKWSLSFGLSHQNPVHISPLSHACHMPCPAHSPWFDLPNDIWRCVQIMKLPTVQLSPFFHYSIPSGPNILLSTLFSNAHRLCSSLNARDQVLHPYRTTGRTVVLYILTFTFLTAGGKAEDFEPNDSKHSPSSVCS